MMELVHSTVDHHMPACAALLQRVRATSEQDPALASSIHVLNPRIPLVHIHREARCWPRDEGS